MANQFAKINLFELKKLLIVAHTPSPNTQRLAKALIDGAENKLISGVTSELRSPFDCDAEHVLMADAVILFTTENFGTMSGALKDFFERIYYPCLNDNSRNEGKPFALVIRAGLDGTGTNIAVHKIISGLKWREAQETLLCHGDFTDEFLTQCEELATTIAASLENKLI